MNTTNHTPSHWKIETCNENGPFLDSFYIQTDAKHWDGNDIKRIICRFPTGTGQFGEMGRENLANANLIASAPDLLEALRFLLADYIAIEGDKLTGSSVPIEMARAAILKAEGNQ